ncbi:MAG: CotH kinase family protein [Oscillospiraceae bacterium]|nr:CotH kinase family protein [Oscillospiraceae bacterium]
MRNKRRICMLLIFIILAMSSFLIACSKTANASATEAESQSETIPEPPNGTAIAISYISSDYTCGTITGTLNQTIEYGISTTTAVTAVPNLGYKFTGWSDGNTNITRSGDSSREDTTVSAIFDYDCYKMPVVIINTGGVDITTKDFYIPGKISIINTDPEHTLDGFNMEIRLRGNHSSTYVDNPYPYNKISYRVNLYKDLNLLGQGKGPAKTWTLLANLEDQTLIREAMGYGFAAQLDNIPYVSSLSYVEVYYNGEYEGVYLLCEQEEVNQYRNNIDDTSDEPDKGYLLEMQEKQSGGNYYFDMSGRTYAVLSKITTPEQEDFIEKYMQNCWDAVTSGDKDRVDAFMDLPSVVDTYIAEETVKNLDVGYENFYMSKSAGGKLYFASIWDVKFGGGNGNQSGTDKWEGLYVGVELGAFQEHPWFIEFMKHNWFRQMVKDRWNALTNQLAWIVPFIQNTAATYHDSFERNFVRWPIMGTAVNREPPPVVKLKTYDEHVNYLVNWMQNRIQWLNDYINSDSFVEQ